MTDHEDEPGPDPVEHYFSADPAVAFKRAPVSAEVWGRRLDLTSGSGVFAQGRVDVGTGILFRETEPPTGVRRLLDLGCGYGVIGLALATALPDAEVVGVDVNERALLLAARERPVARRRRALHRPAARRRRARAHLRRDLVEPADQGRQAGPARAAPALAAPPGARGPGGDGRRQEPRCRLPAALAGGAGLAHHPHRWGQGLPGARDPTSPDVATGAPRDLVVGRRPRLSRVRLGGTGGATAGRRPRRARRRPGPRCPR